LIIKLISALLSIGHYYSFPLEAAILVMLVINTKQVHWDMNGSKTQMFI